MKDLDFERLQITVREGKGDKDRITLLPEAIVAPLQQHHVLLQKGFALKSPVDRYWSSALERRITEGQ